MSWSLHVQWTCTCDDYQMLEEASGRPLPALLVSAQSLLQMQHGSAPARLFLRSLDQLGHQGSSNGMALVNEWPLFFASHECQSRLPFDPPSYLHTSLSSVGTSSPDSISTVAKPPIMYRVPARLTRLTELRSWGNSVKASHLGEHRRAKS